MATYADVILAESSLVGYWILTDSTSTTLDSKGTNNGTYQGVAGTNYLLGQNGLPGDPNQSVFFDGTTGWASIPANASLNLGDVFTIEAWVKRADVSTAAEQRLINKGGSGATGAYSMTIGVANDLRLSRITGGLVVGSTTTITDLTSWHHCVAVKNGATSAQVFIDGRDVSGTVTNLTFGDSTDPLGIGRTGSTADRWLHGNIAHAAIYNAPLTAAQIAAHWQAGVAFGLYQPVRLATRRVGPPVLRRHFRQPFIPSQPGTVIGNQFNQSLTASLTPSGSLSKQTNRALAGGLTPSGTLAKGTARALSAGLTPAGSLAKGTSRALSAGLTPAGTLAKGTARALAASLTPSGSLAKGIARALAASLTPSGSIAKGIARSLTASLTPSGSLSPVKGLATLIGGAAPVARAIAAAVVARASSFLPAVRGAIETPAGRSEAPGPPASSAEASQPKDGSAS